MKSLVAVLVAAGCGTSSLDSAHQAIIGGTRSTGPSATVMLAGYPPDRSVLHSCTAVVVASNVLLTSAHCIDEPTHPDYLYGVFTGDDASLYPTLAELEPVLVEVAAVHPHHQYSSQLPFFADIGVVVLTAPLSVAPLPLQREPIDASIIGKPAHILGYGQTVYGQFDRRRHEAMTTVTAIEDDTIVVGDAQRRPCLGDSGGPAIVDGRLAGIDSYGPVGCDGPAHYRRVDYFMPFIDRFVPSPGGPDAGVEPDPGPEPDGAGGCAIGGGGALPVAAAGWGLRRRRRFARAG